MKDRLVIAIDGPAASGKSSVAAGVAERISALMFDTGALYRALTLAALKRGIPIDDERRLGELAYQVQIDIAPPSLADGRQYDVLLDGCDVTWRVRDTEVDRAVSPVSAHQTVRAALLERQRDIGRSGRIVMPGRDIGTVVVPDADVKVWLDASIGERVRRRKEELAARGIGVLEAELFQEMEQRDRVDSSRAQAPMEPAADAVVIDTDDKSIAEVVEEVVLLVSRVDTCQAGR